MTTSSPDLVLYTTDGCHLCDVAVQVIANAINLEEVYVELIDIAEEPDADLLIENYGTRLPVVKHLASDKEIDWPFDAQMFLHWLDHIHQS